MELTGKVILSLFFIAIVFYNLRHARARSRSESFAVIDVPIDSITSTDIYEKNKNVMCDTLYYGADFLTDSNDIFQARYCLKYQDPNVHNANYDYASAFKNYLQVRAANPMDAYIQAFQMDTMEMESIRKAIQTKLFYFMMANDKEAPVQGPVYAVLTQAPYLLDDDGDVIYHQPFNRADYPMQTPFFAVANRDNVPPTNGVRVYVHLIYLMYDRNRTPIDATRDEFDFNHHYTTQMRALQALRTDHSLCNIKCMNDGGLLCGCVNQAKPYESHCLGVNPTVTPQPQNTNQFTDYMMLYRIQEKAASISPLFSTLLFEDVKI